jgi:hypothetical protein
MLDAAAEQHGQRECQQRQPRRRRLRDVGSLQGSDRTDTASRKVPQLSHS